MSIRILIVDDALIMRVVLKEVLDKPPFEVVGEAKDGEEALVLYRELIPDLTLMDIVLPKKDGLAALNEIIEMDPFAKVIILSALGQSAVVMKAISLGARDFIAKPFHGEKVLEVICRVMGVDYESLQREKLNEKTMRVYRKKSIVD